MQASIKPTSPTRPPYATTYARKRLLKLTPGHLPTHQIAQCSTYATLEYPSTLPVAEHPLIPLEASLGIEMGAPSVLPKTDCVQRHSQQSLSMWRERQVISPQ